jgi:hypothetical protein
MKKVPIVIFLAVILLLPLAAFTADDNQQKIKNYPQQRGEKLQEYKNDIPQHGNYYEWDGRKWQRYEGNIPQVGCYLRKIKSKDNLEKDRSK